LIYTEARLNLGRRSSHARMVEKTSCWRAALVAGVLMVECVVFGDSS